MHARIRKRVSAQHQHTQSGREYLRVWVGNNESLTLQRQSLNSKRTTGKQNCLALCAHSQINTCKSRTEGSKAPIISFQLRTSSINSHGLCSICSFASAFLASKFLARRRCWRRKSDWVGSAADFIASASSLMWEWEMLFLFQPKRNTNAHKPKQGARVHRENQTTKWWKGTLKWYLHSDKSEFRICNRGSEFVGGTLNWGICAN